MKNEITYASSMIHPRVVGTWISKVKDKAGGSSQHGTDFRKPQSAVDSSNNLNKKEQKASSKETMVCYSFM